MKNLYCVRGVCAGNSPCLLFWCVRNACFVLKVLRSPRIDPASVQPFDEKLGKRLMISCRSLNLTLQGCINETDTEPVTNVRSQSFIHIQIKMKFTVECICLHAPCRVFITQMNRYHKKNAFCFLFRTLQKLCSFLAFFYLVFLLNI